MKDERVKRYRHKVKQYNQNGTFQNNERKFYKQLGDKNTMTYQQPNANEAQMIKRINNMKKELQGFKEGTQVIIHLE